MVSEFLKFTVLFGGDLRQAEYYVGAASCGRHQAFLRYWHPLRRFLLTTMSLS